LEKFSPENINHQKLSELRNLLSINENDFVLSYLGSVGTWYMLDDMLDFFSCLLKEKPDSKFLFITNEPASLIHNKAAEKNIPLSKFIVSPAPHYLVPTYLALSSVSIFFIKPVFSKRASSPTKQGEIMGMGIPYVCNAGVGDVDEIVADTNSGFVMEQLSEANYQTVIGQMLSSKTDVQKNIAGAEKYYSLKNGIEKYQFVYKKILTAKQHC
jgi:hypothetical protein